jgi:hypothetical protein
MGKLLTGLLFTALGVVAFFIGRQESDSRDDPYLIQFGFYALSAVGGIVGLVLLCQVLLDAMFD